MHKYKKIKLNPEGFSLLEIIAVLGIISIGLLGVSSLVVQNLQAKNMNQNYLVASMLAQEGLELVRNIRDENWLVDSDEADWKDRGIPHGDFDIVQDKTYTIDYGNSNESIISDASEAVNLISDSGAKLYLNPSGFYTHNSAGNLATPFSRLISIVFDNAKPDEVTVTALVQWSDRGRVQNYTAVTKLYNWR